MMDSSSVQQNRVNHTTTSASSVQAVPTSGTLFCQFHSFFLSLFILWYQVGIFTSTVIPSFFCLIALCFFGFGTFTWTQGWTDDLKSTFLKPQLMRRMFAARCTPAGTWLDDLSQLVLLQLINECTSLFLYFWFSVFFVCLFVCWCFFLSASCPRSSSQTRPLTASLSQMLFTVSSCCCCAVWTCDMAELELLRGFINSGSFPELKNPPQWQGRNK